MIESRFAGEAALKDGYRLALESVRVNGFTIVESVLDRDFLTRTRDSMYAVRDRIVTELGEDRLARAGELGVLRLMLEYDPHFFSIARAAGVAHGDRRDRGRAAILHLQNGFVLPSFAAAEQRQVFQNSYHRDFPRVLNGYVASVNTFLAIDEFTATTGRRWVLPGTHQQTPCPEPPARDSCGGGAQCPAGSMIVFDSTLWHAAGQNVSGRDRLAINQQFTRSFIKQQIDYVRALGDDVVLAQPPRSQQLLGWYTRVVTSLDEYYRPPEQRLYRKGQG